MIPVFLYEARSRGDACLKVFMVALGVEIALAQVPAWGVEAGGPHLHATRFRVRSSETDGLAVSTLFGSCEVPVMELEDELAASELGAQAVAADCLMAAEFQVIDCRSGHLVLKLDAQLVAKAPARRIRSCLKILTVICKPDHDLRVSLRLDRATHHAETHHRQSVLRDERRDDRVKRPFPRR